MTCGGGSTGFSSSLRSTSCKWTSQRGSRRGEGNETIPSTEVTDTTVYLVFRPSLGLEKKLREESVGVVSTSDI